jgi:hypothetical protein
MSAGDVVWREERARRDRAREEAMMRGETADDYRGSMEDQTDLQ